MDVWGITVAALRRWYVFLPLLALTAVAAVRVGDGVAPQYEVSTTAILVPGTAESPIESPYGNRAETTQVIAILLDAARDSLEQRGLTAEYEVKVSASILTVTTLGDSPQEGLDTAEALLELARAELDDRQSAVGIASDAQIGLQVLQAPSVEDLVVEGQVRNMAVVAVVGGALSLLIAVLFDDLMGLLRRSLQRWGERRAARPESARSRTARHSAHNAVPVDQRDEAHRASDAGLTSDGASKRDLARARRRFSDADA